MNWDRSPLKSVTLRSGETQAQSSVPAFAPIHSDAFEHLKNLPPATELPTGSILVHQQAMCDSVDLIQHGLVKLLSVNPDGRQATLGLRTSGWYAGGVSVMMNTTSIYSVVAVTPCTVIRIPAAEFSAKLMQSAKMMRHFMATICNELISQSAAQAEVMSCSAEDRLATFMRERTFDDSRLKVLDPLPLLKQVELAQLLAITPEHLSRLLHKGDRRKVTYTSAAMPLQAV